jgi:hypothetical protein
MKRRLPWQGVRRNLDSLSLIEVPRPTKAPALGECERAAVPESEEKARAGTANRRQPARMGICQNSPKAPISKRWAGRRWRDAPPPLPWRPGPRRWPGRTSGDTSGADAGSPPSLSRAGRSKPSVGAGRRSSPGASRSPGTASAPCAPAASRPPSPLLPPPG